MNQLDLALATAKKSIYETIPYSEFHPSLEGSLRFRVNLSRAMWTQWVALGEESDRLEAVLKSEAATAEEKAAARVQASEANERALAFIASLIPTSETDDTPVTLEALKEFIARNANDDEDLHFADWLIEQITRRVGEYQKQHFLSRMKSRNESAHGDIPQTSTAQP